MKGKTSYQNGLHVQYYQYLILKICKKCDSVSRGQNGGKTQQQQQQQQQQPWLYCYIVYGNDDCGNGNSTVIFSKLQNSAARWRSNYLFYLNI